MDNNSNIILYTEGNITSNIIYKIHVKYGHIGFKPILQLIKINNIKITKNNIQKYNKYICKVYLKTKANRNINKIFTNITNYNILDKIYSDLRGLIKPFIYNNYKYYITFLD